MVSRVAALAVWPAEVRVAWLAAAPAYAVVALAGYAAAVVAAMWDGCCRECRKRRGKLSPRSSCSSPKLKAQP